MEHSEILREMLTIIGWLIVLLATVVAWIGKRIHDRLDDINTTLQRIDKDLSLDVANLDKRLTVLESVCENHHR